MKTILMEYRRGNYVVRALGDRIEFERLEEPRCHGQIISFQSYSLGMGETFFGSDGECIVGLKWPSGEPDEAMFFSVVSAFEDDLADWREWPASTIGAVSDSSAVA